MLGKLMKYELRATARTMLPGFAAVIVLAGLTRLSAELLMSRGDFLTLVGTIVTVLFVLACMAIGILALIIMIQRFRDNLLGDQGYLMHTLPVTTAANIFAKVLTSVIWYFGTAVVGMLAILTLVARQNVFSSLFESIKRFFDWLTPGYAAHGVAWVLEFLLLVTLSLSLFSLMIYAAMSLGYQANSHRGVLSVLIFLGFNVALQIVGGLLAGWAFRSASATVTNGMEFRIQLFRSFSNLSNESQIHLVLLGASLLCAVGCAIFYFLTADSLKKHLNLQ
jgi:hypothetical protein